MRRRWEAHMGKAVTIENLQSWLAENGCFLGRDMTVKEWAALSTCLSPEALDMIGPIMDFARRTERARMIRILRLGK